MTGPGESNVVSSSCAMAAAASVRLFLAGWAEGVAGVAAFGQCRMHSLEEANVLRQRERARA